MQQLNGDAPTLVRPGEAIGYSRGDNVESGFGLPGRHARIHTSYCVEKLRPAPCPTAQFSRRPRMHAPCVPHRAIIAPDVLETWPRHTDHCERPSRQHYDAADDTRVAIEVIPP